jgi:Fe-S cluster assembly protein SufD
VIALPTRRDEAFRYSDTEALSRIWPVASERVVVAAGETQRFEIVNLADAEDVVVRNLEIVLEAGARAELHILNAGGRLGRIALDITCKAGSDFSLGAVQLGTGKQTLEIVSTVRHVEPGAISRQVVRTILSNGAVGTYLGKVEVARGADGTDSEQDAKAMLLDRLSTANAVPQLEIYADDVKCAHGCAIGELDPMGLFYLQARGIAPAEAKKLMLQAFVAGVFEGEDALLEAALGKLGAMV